ncbi:hypothetical protein SEA_SLOOPYJOE_62 [Arthrobacter phage Sloopyjoe]|nr:hypothetical protein SEA_SLOOPYJOE_62 [Arthrobacter phage Sloopyjoe]
MSFSKERVPVTVNGERVGTAEISDSGLLTMSVNSPVVAKSFELSIIESLSISAKIKKD